MRTLIINWNKWTQTTDNSIRLADINSERAASQGREPNTVTERLRLRCEVSLCLCLTLMNSLTACTHYMLMKTQIFCKISIPQTKFSSSVLRKLHFLSHNKLSGLMDGLLSKHFDARADMKGGRGEKAAGRSGFDRIISSSTDELRHHRLPSLPAC